MREVERRIRAAAAGMFMGHQLGQWSERRWWRSGPEAEAESLDTALSDGRWLATAVGSPPRISTPGWTPTGVGDLMPLIVGLAEEYGRGAGVLSPEDFRDFLLRERGRLMPQAVGRTCIELMAEGMNPRIAGLYSPSVLYSCWVAWPVGLAHAGRPDGAFEEAALLARAQAGGDAVMLAAVLASLLASAITPAAAWDTARSAALGRLRAKDGRLAELAERALEAGRDAIEASAWAVPLSDPAWIRSISRYPLDLLADFYRALAALEWCFARSVTAQDLARAVLESSESRFPAMIALSVCSAFRGIDAMPALWMEAGGGVHAGSLGRLVSASLRAVDAGSRSARAAAARIGSLDGDSLADRILAGLLAGAAGNSMGAPVEDRDWPWIEERYGVLDRFLEPDRFERDDDSAMTRIWAEAYIERGGRISVEDLAGTIRRRLDRSGYYYDTQHGCDLLASGIPAHACGHWNIVTGSSMMGCAPCGMYNAGDPRSAARDARELAYLWQRGFDVHGAAIMCAAVAEALCPGATVESVIEAAIEAAPADPQVHFDRREPRDARGHLRRMVDGLRGCSDVLAARRILYAGFLEYNGQDPWEVVTFTLGIFGVSRGDVWQCMLGGTNIGRDSDTIANLSATLAACMHGTAALPRAAMELFRAEQLEEYRRLARGLAQLALARAEESRRVAAAVGIA